MVESQKNDVVLFVGDSLTEGGRWDEWFPEFDSRNFGVSGNTAQDVLERIDEVIAEEPQVVVLMVGTNDLAWRRSVEQTVRTIESILWRLHSELPKARLIIQSVLPRDRERAAEVKDINIHLRQFAPTVKAEWLDLWPVFAADDGEVRADFSADRLHLTDEGYSAWAGVLRPVLVPNPSA